RAQRADRALRDRAAPLHAGESALHARVHRAGIAQATVGPILRRLRHDTGDIMSDFTCSAISREAGEQLFGTAPRIDVWFLLEYTGRWEPEALDSALPEPVKRAMSAQLETAAPARFGLI